MRNRSKALISQVEGDSNSSLVTSHVLSLKSTSMVSNLLGRSKILKAALTRFILYNAQYDQLEGYMCSYLMRILAWTGMFAVYFMIKTLVIQELTVFYDT